MGGPDAGRVITVVANIKAVWNGAMMQLPRHAVGGVYTLLVVNPPISLLYMCSCPEPTGICLNDLRPKAFFDRTRVGCAALVMAFNEAVLFPVRTAVWSLRAAAASAGYSRDGILRLHRKILLSVSCSRLFLQRESHLYYNTNPDGPGPSVSRRRLPGYECKGCSKGGRSNLQAGTPQARLYNHRKLGGWNGKALRP